VVVRSLHHKLRKQAAELDGSNAPEVDDAEDENEVIVCDGCGHPVTDAASRIEIAERHEHTCVNPAGHVYRIGCYQHAPGCLGHGSQSDHYSWFEGYSWQISLCGKCHMHLGWAFEGAEHRFFGLIVDRIRPIATPSDGG